MNSVVLNYRIDCSKTECNSFIIRAMETSGKVANTPILGEACRAAADYGIDLHQLDASLALTPLERLIRHDQALDLILAAIAAGIRYYGIDPRSVEALKSI